MGVKQFAKGICRRQKSLLARKEIGVDAIVVYLKNNIVFLKLPTQ